LTLVFPVVSERIQLRSLPGPRQNCDLSWRGPIKIKIRNATMSERAELKLEPKKVPNLTNCRTLMNRAKETPAPNPLSLVKKANQRPRE
jgi:hypothetical protein